MPEMNFGFSAMLIRSRFFTMEQTSWWSDNARRFGPTTPLLHHSVFVVTLACSTGEGGLKVRHATERFSQARSGRSATRHETRNARWWIGQETGAPAACGPHVQDG